MIKEVTMYQCVCDRCGKVHVDDFNGFVAWTDGGYAADAAGDDGWIGIDGKHYCPDCYEIDEESDDYVPKKTED